jgi:DNA-binding LacI/PurR family transcriptional regulator
MKTLLALPLAQRPTAFFCATDDIALHAMRAALDAGLKVPAEMSFIGFGGIDASPLIRPALTTYSANVVEMGRWAYQRLKALREGADPMPQRHVIPVKMTERDSCARCK